MKIAMPVTTGGLDAHINPSFGRSPFYLLYDTETKLSSVLVNPAAEASGGAGIKAAEFLSHAGTEILLSPRSGENAREVLEAQGIEMFKSMDGTARENIEAYLKGELKPLEDFHPGHHNHA